MTLLPNVVQHEPSSNSPSAPQSYAEGTILFIHFFVSVATIIGSGLLALPISLYQTSVPVFITLLTIVLMVQISTAFILVDLLHFLKLRFASVSESLNDYKPIPGQSSDLFQNKTGSFVLSPTEPYPTIYDLADFYLESPFLSIIFSICTFLVLYTSLTTYGLGGGQLLWSFASNTIEADPPWFVFFFFWTFGTTVVLFFLERNLKLFSYFTVLKVILFAIAVLAILCLPPSTKVYPLSSIFAKFGSWNNVVKPLLVSCFALGGVPNSIPIVFRLIPITASKQQLRRVSLSISGGICFCYILNISWVLAVFQCVPRSAPLGMPSLDRANDLGQVSIVPLIEQLHLLNINTGLVSILIIMVQSFVFISTMLSFLIVGASLKSFVDGAVTSIADRIGLETSQKRYMLLLSYVLSFGAVLQTILKNQRGYLQIITKYAALTMVIQSGLALNYMFVKSARYFHSRPRTTQIPKYLGTGLGFCGILFFGTTTALSALQSLQ